MAKSQGILPSLMQWFNRRLGTAASTDTQAQDAARQRTDLAEVLDTLPLGLLVVDGDGTVRLANPTFQLLLSLPRDPLGELIGQLPSGAELKSLLQQAKTSGAASRGSFVPPQGRLRLSDKRQLSATAVSLNDGGLVLLQDLSESLRQLQAHRELVADVSHEIKTPLTAIRGYAETLADGALERPEVAARFTERILDQCQRLENLLNDLLTAARLESERQVQQEPVEVDLRACLQRALEVVESQAAAQDVQLVTSLRPVPALRGHADELERMLLNLLENSIKYNRPQGRVEVTLEADDEAIVLGIEDFGIGIPPQDLERIFDRFYRVDKGRSREQGGSGLGLAIVQQVVKLHGGRIEVESRLGHGSRFSVHLPHLPQPQGTP